MTLPAGMSTVTVTGTYKHPGGTAITGHVVFEPEPAVLTSATHGTLVLGPTIAGLDVNGAVTAVLLATDDPDVTPIGWTYRVTERWHDAPGRSYPLSLPAATPTVNLADVAPTAPAEGEYVVITGPAGAQGPQGATGATGPAGPQPPLGAAGAGADIALRSTDPTTTNARTPTPHATTHASAGSDPLNPTAIGAATQPAHDALAERVAAVEAGFATVNGYITDALIRIQSLETRMTNVENRVTDLENP